MIHIEGCASQDMAYLTKYFVFLHQDPNLTRIIPNLNNLEYGYMNKFGTVTFTNKDILIAGQYKKVLPYTIILPEHVKHVKNLIYFKEIPLLLEIDQILNDWYIPQKE